MNTPFTPLNRGQLVHFTSRKAAEPDRQGWLAVGETSDSLAAWSAQYLALAVTGVRSAAVAQKIQLHLDRFRAFFVAAYGHDRLSTVLKRDVVAWQRHLAEEAGFAPATVNNHLASLSACMTWVHAQAPRLFHAGDPAKGVAELGLPPLEPRALSPEQVRSLKNLLDRLERFHELRGRRWAKPQGAAGPPVRATGRPWRDRALVYGLLSTGLRREEVVHLDLDQVVPNTPAELRRARGAKITRVAGKGKSQREVFLSADARAALADYLERERPRDAAQPSEGEGEAVMVATPALLLSAKGLPARSADGRLSVRAVNLIVAQIGRWHDGELDDPKRHLSPLHPHALRHTFAFQLAEATGKDAYELERRLGHRSQRYIARYTNPPAGVAATYVEEF